MYVHILCSTYYIPTYVSIRNSINVVTVSYLRVSDLLKRFSCYGRKKTPSQAVHYLGKEDQKAFRTELLMKELEEITMR